MKKITNLTNSPYDLIGLQGTVRLPAFDSVEGEFSDEYIGLLQASNAVKVEEIQRSAEDEISIDGLRDEYEILAEKPADKRWNEKRLAEEIEKLKA